MVPVCAEFAGSFEGCGPFDRLMCWPIDSACSARVSCARLLYTLRRMCVRRGGASGEKALGFSTHRVQQPTSPGAQAVSETRVYVSVRALRTHHCASTHCQHNAQVGHHPKAFTRKSHNGLEMPSMCANGASRASRPRKCGDVAGRTDYGEFSGLRMRASSLSIPYPETRLDGNDLTIAAVACSEFAVSHLPRRSLSRSVAFPDLSTTSGVPSSVGAPY